MFLFVGIGWVFGFWIFAKVIEYLFAKSEMMATWLFIGLIIGTIPALYKEAGKHGRSKGSFVSMFVAFAVLTSTHLDIIGFLCMLLTGFGWAKPVKVNPRNFKKYKKGMAITAIAGPLSNIMLSFVCIFILSFMARFDILYLYAGKASFAGDFTTSLLTVISSIIFQMAYLNLYLAVFNLIPVPPLDGSRIVSYVLPGKISYYYDRYGQYFQYGLFAILLVFMYTDIFNPIAWIADTVFDGFVSFWSLIF